jgi:hypothetical protein
VVLAESEQKSGKLRRMPSEKIQTPAIIAAKNHPKKNFPGVWAVTTQRIGEAACPTIVRIIDPGIEYAGGDTTLVIVLEELWCKSSRIPIDEVEYGTRGGI